MAKKLPDVSNQPGLGALVRPPSPTSQKRRSDQEALRGRERQANLGGLGGSFLSTEPFDAQRTANWGKTQQDLKVTQQSRLGVPVPQMNIPSNTTMMPSLGRSASSTGNELSSMPPFNPNEFKEPKLPKAPKASRPQGGRHRAPSPSGKGIISSLSRGLEFYAGLTHHLQGRNAEILKAYGRAGQG